MRLRIPISMKSRLEGIAGAKEINFTDVLLLLINKFLQRKPDLFEVIDRPVDLVKIEQDLISQKMRVISAYNLMRLEIAPVNKKVEKKIQIFIAEAEEFVRQLSEKL